MTNKPKVRSIQENSKQPWLNPQKNEPGVTVISHTIVTQNNHAVAVYSSFFTVFSAS
jgi:hypothetical protein